MPWIQEIELVNSIQDLKASQSIAGRVCRYFETLDEKIATASKKIVQGSALKVKIFLEAHKAQNEDRFLRGCQIACMIDEISRVTGTHESILGFTDLLNFTPRGKMMSKDLIRDGMKISYRSKKRLKITFLESMYKMRRRDWLCTTRRSSRKRFLQAIRGCKNRAKKFKDQNLRNRHFEARNDRTVTGTLAKQRGKGDAKSCERRKGDCYQWKAKRECSKRDACSKDRTLPSVCKGKTER